jgi:signal transduction histidine kinase
MIEQIEALNKIASDFSKFAKPIKQAFADISINDVVKSVADLYLNEPGIELSLKLDKQKFIISGVNEELRRALINLVKNGIEAMEGSGTITIKTYRIPHTRQCRIELHDTGGGISDEHRHNIFTPNFSTKTSGTGLGLAITKQIIEEHQGSISFNTKPGKSTTFIIDLPLK